MRFVLVEFGGGWGTQVACVLAERNDGAQLRVRKWKGNSRAWTGPVWLPSTRVLRAADGRDFVKYHVDPAGLR
jgi:hypothetical protein